MFLSKNSFAAALFVGAALTISGCSSATPQQAPPDSDIPSESTVVIDGKAYTCAEIIVVETCGSDTAELFDKYKQNIESYVQSGELGPLNSNAFSYEDVAYAGLMACLHGSEGEDAYVDFMLSEGGAAYADLQRVDLLPAYFEASKSLCREEFTAGLPGDDVVTP